MFIIKLAPVIVFDLHVNLGSCMRFTSQMEYVNISPCSRCMAWNDIGSAVY